MNTIFCIWSGNNDMSYNRAYCLNSIIHNTECDVVLVGPNNLKEFEIGSDPIHPAYQYLSLTHKADYLRAYLLHHHGGGYTDIKYINFSWKKYFALLYNSDLLFVGYPEKRPEHIASKDPDIIANFKKLCGCGHFIFKSKTQFTTIWLNLVNSILESKISFLKQHPGHYHPRAINGGVQGEPYIHKDSLYPLAWNEILGSIIHPLMYQFKDQYLPIMPYPNLYSYL